MYCGHCGGPVMPGQVFCSKCGAAVSGAGASPSAATPTPPQPSTGPGSPPPQTSPGYARSSRVARHLSVLGILWIIFSVLRLIPGLAMMFFGHMRFPFMMMPIPAPLRLTLAPFLFGIGVLVAGFAIAGVIAGWGLMSHAPWARMLAIVLGCISLIHIPFGTALGIYTLWVLVPAGADAEYQRLARAG
ncbi:MAG: zinc ribbon domain-containing protein [Acidobacteriia bacterium]|nr:zinc ribbon domain-containing protein [Terriglobia bacterium]